MIKLNKTDGLLMFIVSELGGCINETALNGMLQPRRIAGGELDGYHGYLGHNREKDVSWTLVPFGGYWGLETVPSTFESWIIMKFTG